MKKKSVLMMAFLAWFAFFSGTVARNENDLIMKGREITNQIGKQLVQTVLQAVGRGGVKEGVGFCHVHALPLTDSLSKHYHVEVRRVALRYRNEQNKPSQLEENILRRWEATLKETGEVPTEELLLDSLGGKLYFRPIVLQPTCQMCHGRVGESITADNHALIREKYPTDKAIDFKVGDIRGMWVLRFPNR